MIKVEVMFNGASNLYEFDMEHERFMEKWGHNINEVGYFQAYEKTGHWIVINPSQCGTIDIWEWNPNS